MRGLLTGLAIFAASPVVAQQPVFGFPVDCTLGDTCYIQQYLDHDPGPDWNDYTCSTLSYDGHRGTDIAVPTLADMEAGVNVVAASPGKVLAIRDGMEDQYFTKDTAAEIEGRDCGNRVAIGHGGGLITDYCHLKKGSIQVKKGDRVAMGAVLGQVGLSGRTQFPHLHFSVQKRGKHVDPFAPDGVTQCDGPVAKSMWLDTPAYVPGGIIDVGFAAGVPDYAAVKAGTQRRGFDPTSDAVVFWIFGYGLKKGDVLRYGFDGPDGVTFENDMTFDRNKALMLRSGGKKRRLSRWPAGEYTGFVEVSRGNKILTARTHTFTLP